MENTQEDNSVELKRKDHTFRYGAIFGFVVGWVVIHHTSRDTGDLPSLAIALFFTYIAATLVGGLGAILVKETLQAIKGSKLHYVGFTVCLLVFAYSLYICYANITGVIAFRKKMMNDFAKTAIRDYKGQISDFYSSRGRHPQGLDELRKTYGPRKIYGSPRERIENGIRVEYVLVPNDKNTPFTFRAYHVEGDREYQLSSKSFEIISRKFGTETWEIVN